MRRVPFVLAALVVVVGSSTIGRGDATAPAKLFPCVLPEEGRDYVPPSSRAAPDWSSGRHTRLRWRRPQAESLPPPRLRGGGSRRQERWGGRPQGARPPHPVGGGPRRGRPPIRHPRGGHADPQNRREG